MDWSVVSWVLILSGTTSSSLVHVADNTILDYLNERNDSINVYTPDNNTTPFDNGIDIINITTTTTTTTTTTAPTTTPIVTTSETSDTTLEETHTTCIECVETTNAIITTTNDESSTSGTSSTVTRTSESTDGTHLPEQSIEEIEVESLIQTSHGPVRGFLWRGLPGILSYIDIPYGKFEKYFKPPMPPDLWNEVHQETNHKILCPQMVDGGYVGDIDCLTLSIFTPFNAVNASVLFYIHESHLASGSGDPAKYGPEYLVPRGIILVMPNFRLGPLGFLCLRNETAPGNAALKDLTLALNWTRNNIHAFGGNPDDINLSGDGTSGALAGYLALSPKSSHYISKVITESGSVLSHWALERNPDMTAEILAEKIRKQEEINYNNTFEEATIEAIVTSAKDMQLQPCIEHGDDAFIENTPWEMLHESNINLTFMIGAANLAGAREAIWKTENSITNLNEDFSKFLPSDLQFKSDEQRDEIAKRVKAFYFKEDNISAEHVQELALCCTDALYLWPSIRISRPLLGAGSTVYLYEFSFVGLLNRELIAINKTLNGAVKGDLVGYLFTQDGVIPPEDTKERRIVNLMADLWTSFVKTGKPTAENVEWDPVSTLEDSDEVYLSIGAHCKQKQGIHVERIRLWTEIYDEHFIEHNHAWAHKASMLALFVTLVHWLGLCKSTAHF